MQTQGRHGTSTTLTVANRIFNALSFQGIGYKLNDNQSRKFIESDTIGYNIRLSDFRAAYAVRRPALDAASHLWLQSTSWWDFLLLDWQPCIMYSNFCLKTTHPPAILVGSRRTNIARR
ncbi:MAG: hypothetical protein EBS29_10910 [Chloroflexia bacterium]|nr:hypothetical protein [Chloroflexia bacterium]